MKMVLLLLLTSNEYMIIAMNVVRYMLVMIIHELGVDKCVVVVKLLCFYDFCENGS